MSPAVSQFCAFYRQPGSGKLNHLDQIYTDTIIFEDPVHRITGLDNITDYLTAMMSNLSHCQFTIHTVMEQKNQAFIQWTMHFGHPRLGNGKIIEVPGVSHLHFAERVYFHRDYLDMGAMLYEHVPLLGKIIRQLKHRLAQ